MASSGGQDSPLPKSLQNDTVISLGTNAQDCTPYSTSPVDLRVLDESGKNESSCQAEKTEVIHKNQCNFKERQDTSCIISPESSLDVQNSRPQKCISQEIVHQNNTENPSNVKVQHKTPIIMSQESPSDIQNVEANESSSHAKVHHDISENSSNVEEKATSKVVSPKGALEIQDDEPHKDVPNLNIRGKSDEKEGDSRVTAPKDSLEIRKCSSEAEVHQDSPENLSNLKEVQCISNATTPESLDGSSDVDVTGESDVDVENISNAVLEHQEAVEYDEQDEASRPQSSLISTTHPFSMTRESSDIDVDVDVTEDLLTKASTNPEILQDAEMGDETKQRLMVEIFQNNSCAVVQFNSLDKLDGNGTAVCPYCNEKFTRPYLLKNHMVKHTGEKPFKCTDCDKEYAYESGLRRHSKIHSGGRKRNHICAECGHCFAELGHLKEHWRIHTLERPFACSVCKRAFKRRGDLNSHEMTHTGYKPHTCEECGKCFAQKSHLKIHIRVHTGERPYVCTLCEKRFACKSSLNSHSKTHTDIKPFDCEVCGKSFRDNVQLRTHYKSLRHRKKAQ